MAAVVMRRADEKCRRRSAICNELYDQSMIALDT